MLEKEAPEGRTRKERASKLREAGKTQVRDNYIPINKDDIKHSIEIPVKQKLSKQELETIISPGKIKTKRANPKKKAMGKVSSKKTLIKSNTSTKSSAKTFSSPEITLKKSGYELVITEKPQAAEKIAIALDDKNRPARKAAPNKVTYYEVNRDGKKIVVGCAVGHLFTLKQTESGSSVPVFNVQWVPNYYVRKTDFSKRYYDVLSKLVKGASSLTVATDFDVEGEVIGLNIIRYLAGQKDASRMKFSTLTNAELNKAYDNKYKTLIWGQAIAGETRHYLDWFYGINLSRALMNAIKTTGSFKIMSIGRVQGPALKLIVDKEKEIQAFKSTPYWQVFIDVKDKKSQEFIELKHNKDITKKSELKNFENLKDKVVDITTTKSTQTLTPPPPFNLTTLQTEAYRLHGITPARTLQLAQSLYLAGLISYPRTSSQKLPDSIAYQPILKKLAAKFKAEHLIKRTQPYEGTKTDPAHPSIYPTGENMSTVMNDQEEKIYNLIIKRFLSLFCEDAKIDNKNIKAELQGGGGDFSQPKGSGEGKQKLSDAKEGKVRNQEKIIFTTRGSEIKNKGWLSIYPIKMEEKFIPDLEGEYQIENSRIDEKETQPPNRFSPASILSQLEKRNLGTKATRANILETLYDRGYIKEKSIEATPLGLSLINTMEKYSPIIIDEKLTREFEKEMNNIETATKGLLEKEKTTIEKAKEAITKIISQFEENENKIGKELLNATQNLREQEKKENTLDIKCPNCKIGNLAITYSPKTKKHFIACNAYPKCKTTFSLPPGNIKQIKNSAGEPTRCKECNSPMMMRLAAGKRPWVFCFNPECPSRKNQEVGAEKNKTE